MHSFDAVDDADDLMKSCIYVGEKCAISGDMIAADLVVVDGAAEGSIQARRLKIGPGGTVRGSIVAADASIFGRVIGDMEIKQSLSIHSTGYIEGIASYGDLSVEKGAIIKAKLPMAKHQSSGVPATNRKTDMQSPLTYGSTAKTAPAGVQQPQAKSQSSEQRSPKLPIVDL